MKRRIISLLTVLASLAPALAFAQGVQTGTLIGSVKSSDGIALSEAAVVISSPALQGQRTAETDVNGNYVVATLPPGTYTVRIAKSGLSPVELTARVPLGGTATADAILSVAAVAETLLVEGVTPPAVTAIQTSANITAAEVNVLPMGRTPFLIAELMPGLTTNTPSPNQLTISGGFAYDNVFLIDGVDVNDNLLGTVNDLYIEDAIGEVQVLTSGIPAEYGRFSGGVVNIITKSGSNRFDGSYRTTFSRPSWTSETPFERSNNIERGQPTAANPFLRNKLSHFSELTAGGPVVRDRVWFFGAGRFENSSTSGTMPATGVAYTKTNDSKRFEAKLTGTVRPSHTLQGSFVDNRVHRGTEPVLSFSIDRAALISPSTPNRLAVVNYNGALSARMLLSAQYSHKHFATEGVGGTSTNIIDSPFLTRTGTQYQYNAPYFDASDPERRNNRQLTASVSYFASDRSFGSHELKAGVENFVDIRAGAGAQSSTGYVFMSNFKMDALGAPVLDADGHPIPQFVSGRFARAALDSPARRGAESGYHVGVRAESLDRVAEPHAEPRHAPRAHVERGDWRRQRLEHDARRAPHGRELRPQRRWRDRPAGELLAVFGQVQRGAVFTEHQRRQLGPLHLGVQRPCRRRAHLRPGIRRQQLQRRRGGARFPRSTSSSPMICRRP